jgi:valyl-tRNA synthetase
MNELPKVYDPAQVEGRWYREWIDQNYFHADANTPKAPYTIVIPPPNVTGSLHMGHALFATLQDILIRWRRMQGYNALWLPGTDHAGIATQLVVERRLWREEQKTRHDIGREAFLERVWQWKQRSGGRIIEQLKVMGASCDWQRERFTMDEGLSRAVREAFVRLYEQGLIYRARRLINWCPRCHSALSDLEVEHTETDGKLWHIAYPVGTSGERLVVATTRPETLLGDTAVAVHPEDERFRHLIGQRAELPLTGRTIPIIGDAVLVDREFGTGAVKVTPGHDFNDFETGLRHGLEMISVFDADARLNENAPPAYRGLSTKEARERVLADLEAASLLQGEQPHKLSLGQCERCGTVVEPMLSLQWFVKTGPLARPAIEAVEQGKTRFVPESWTKTYMHWMTNIKDWCISRQLWWGHRIPAWYCAACREPTVARETPAACAHCGHKELRQDEDVLDTWFSSALWPFSTLGWPDDTKDLRTFYPTSVMETGYDIIFFWVARMMMMGLHFMKEVPFQTVFLHALVVDENGDKMSKVKGNVIDPLDVIHGAALEQLLAKAQGDGAGAPREAHDNIKKHFPEGIPAAGADALRFTLAAMAAQGRNIRLAVNRVEGYRHFANKIWNAARFTLMNLEGHDADRWHDELGAEGRERLGLGDRWILSRLQRTVAEVDQALESFKFNEAAQAIYRFLWTEFCDWYIELAKPSLQAAGTPGAEARRRTAQGALSSTLEVACRLLHPFMPFITEEIWQQLPRPSGSSGSILIAMYPAVDETLIDAAAERSMALVQQVVTAVRNLRSEYRVGPGVQLDVTVMSADAATRAEVEAHAELIQGLGRVRELKVALRGEPPHGTVVSVVGGDAASAGMDIDVAVNLEGQIDVAAERSRIAKDLAKTEKDLLQSQAKLEKPSFVERAPPAVVEEERRRLAESSDRIAKLKASLERLERL